MYFSNSRYVLFPPFLTTLLVESDSRDPSVLFIQVLEAIKAFDKKHKDDDEYSLAMDQSFNVLVFLWAASKHEIPSFNQISDSR